MRLDHSTELSFVPSVVLGPLTQFATRDRNEKEVREDAKRASSRSAFSSLSFRFFDMSRRGRLVIHLLVGACLSI